MSCAYKIATAAGAQSYQAYATDGVGTTIYTGCVVFENGSYDVLSLPASASTTSTDDTAPDPPSVSGLTGDFVILNIAFWHALIAGADSVSPGANYTEEWEVTANTDLDLALALRSLSALTNATEDPPAWTDAIAPNGTSSMTIAIKGSNALAAGSYQERRQRRHLH